MRLIASRYCCTIAGRSDGLIGRDAALGRSPLRPPPCVSSNATSPPLAEILTRPRFSARVASSRNERIFTIERS